MRIRTSRLALRSLRQRLLAAAALWIALALGVAGVLLVLLFRHHVEEELAHRVQAQLDALTAGLSVAAAPSPDAGAPPALTLSTEPPDPAFQQPLGGLYWLVVAEGSVRLRSRSWWDHTLPPKAGLAWPTVPVGGVERFSMDGPAGQTLWLWARGVELAGLVAPVVVAVGADATRLKSMTRSFAFTVGAALVVLAVALWTAAWLQVRSGLAPLARLQAALQEVRQGRSKRIAGPNPSEVQPLVDELNTVLDDNDRLLEQARQQAGNLAHALKTPLAVSGNAARRWPGEEGDLLRQQLGLMQRQIDWHLMCARAAAGSGMAQRRGLHTPVGPHLEELKRVLARLHADRAVQLALECPLPGPSVAVAPEALKEMLGNLLDNACRWARQRVRVQVDVATASPGDDGTAWVHIRVDDDGPGIAPAQRAQALQRGMRLDERQPGSGLGLAIVDELARVHHGTLKLTDSDLHGLRAVLSLPAA